MSARVGAVLDGKYELIRLIGKGGMGEIYEGRHRVIARRVAVKFLHGEHARNPDVVLRFENEARAAGGIEHENIAGLYDVGALPDGTRYLVMEFLEGEDVDKLVRREAPLPTARAASIVIQACRALDVVHQRGIVHRDLKPSNLFLAKRADKSDLVKVIDFGIAKLKTSDGDPGTKTGKAIGTAHYMSPEQARGERDVDTRSDVYSLGVILYELLSGKKPHDGDSLLQILHKVMTQPPVPLESVRPGLPEALYAVIRRAMSPDVAGRYAEVADFGDAILPFAGRALPPIRSQPTSFEVATTDSGETRASAESVYDVPAPLAGASVAGLVRSEPNGSAAAPPSRALPPRRTRALVAGGFVALLGLVGVLTVVAVSLRHTNPEPASPAGSPLPALGAAPPALPSTSAFPAVTAVAPLAPPSQPILDASTATTSTAPGPRPARIQPSGHRTSPSEHFPVDSPVAAPTQAAVPPLPAAVPSATAAPMPSAPPLKPTATDRGDNPF